MLAGKDWKDFQSCSSNIYAFKNQLAFPKSDNCKNERPQSTTTINFVRILYFVLIDIRLYERLWVLYCWPLIVPNAMQCNTILYVLYGVPHVLRTQ
jgi:hypothetical protein